MIGSEPLAGKTILITRPVEQARTLARLIRDAGGEPIIFPAIEIRPPSYPSRLRETLSRPDQFDLAIFISPTAVESAWNYIDSSWFGPSSMKVAAIGQGTARALREHGIEDIIAPSEKSDSEALLALPELQEVQRKNIVIFRGEGGRELLAQTLAERGAKVEHAECYLRARPDVDISPLLRQHARKPLDAMILTSREGLINLEKMLGAAWSQFEAVPAFVTHERIGEAARAAGLSRIEFSEGGDAGLVQSMVKFFKS